MTRYPTAMLPEDAVARAFADAWRRPTPEGLGAILHPDVVLYQPRQGPIRGRDAAMQAFGRLLRWLPGVHGTVDRWEGSGGTVFIEWRLIAPVGGRDVVVRAVDRITVREGLIGERAAYFDPAPFLAAALRHPSYWGRTVTYRRGT